MDKRRKIEYAVLFSVVAVFTVVGAVITTRLITSDDTGSSRDNHCTAIVDFTPDPTVGDLVFALNPPEGAIIEAGDGYGVAFVDSRQEHVTVLQETYQGTGNYLVTVPRRLVGEGYFAIIGYFGDYEEGYHSSALCITFASLLRESEPSS